MLNTYKGATGSIRCVRCHQTLPVVAACGLDGFVRVYDLESKKLLHKACHVNVCMQIPQLWYLLIFITLTLVFWLYMNHKIFIPLSAQYIGFVILLETVISFLIGNVQ